MNFNWQSTAKSAYRRTSIITSTILFFLDLYYIILSTIWIINYQKYSPFLNISSIITTILIVFDVTSLLFLGSMIFSKFSQKKFIHLPMTLEIVFSISWASIAFLFTLIITPKFRNIYLNVSHKTMENPMQSLTKKYITNFRCTNTTHSSCWESMTSNFNQRFSIYADLFIPPLPFVLGSTLSTLL